MTFAARPSRDAASSFTAVTRVYTTTGTGVTETVPPGASNVVIEIVGHGGQGGLMLFDGIDNWMGGGGGGGGYSRSSYSCSGGQTLSYTLPSTNTATTVSSGTLSITTMTANSGSSGQDGSIGGSAAGGGGGTASGGTQANTSGASGSSGGQNSGGTGANATSTINGGSYGAGGSGASSYTVRDTGALGAVIFRYT